MPVDAILDDVRISQEGPRATVVVPANPERRETPARESVRRLRVLARPKPAAEITTAPAATPEASERQPMTRRRVLALATPIIGENLLQTLVGVVDTFMVASLGAAAVAGVGTGFELIFFVIALLSAIDIGATVLISQAIGAGDRQRANHFARQAVVWSAILAIPVSIGMFLAAPSLIGIFGTEPDVAHAATTYLEITAATSLAMFLSFISGAVLRGAGDSRTPLRAAVLANAVNIFVAYALIFGHFGLPELGVAGSAFGAAAGRSVGAAYMLRAMLSGKKAISLRGRTGWMPRLTTARDLLRLGVPAAVEQVLAAGAFMVLISVVSLVGTAALAAQQITFTALSLAFLPGIGFSIAATSLVGQSLGARVPADAARAARISLQGALLWMGTGSVLAFLLSEPVMRLFSSDADVVAAGSNALRALSIALPFWALWFISGGGLRGSGDTRTPLIIGAATMWASVVIAWLAVRYLDGGLGMIWLSFVLTTTPSSFLMWRAFRRRIADYESGRRALPTLPATPAH